MEKERSYTNKHPSVEIVGSQLKTNGWKESREDDGKKCKWPVLWDCREEG